MRKAILGIAAVVSLTAVASGTETSVPFINADDVHALGITGRGVTVAVIDEGIDYSHPSLLGSIADGGATAIGNQTIANGGAASPGMTHGTLMSLIITDVSGVAPNAKILPIKLQQGSQGATFTSIRNAILYVQIRRMSTDSSIRVISLSFGGELLPCHCDGLFSDMSAAVTLAAQMGIVTVACTGNDSRCGGMWLPACLSNVVQVAASYDDNYGQVPPYPPPASCADPFSAVPHRITCFSNIAEDCANLLAAPGYDVTVADFTQPNKWGTSDSAAHVSGVAALMFEKNLCGSLDADTARTILVNTADAFKFGFGVDCPLAPQPRHVNALDAVNGVTAGLCSFTPGDMNCDGRVDIFDTSLFLDCFFNGNPLTAAGLCNSANIVSFPPFVGGEPVVDLRDFAAMQNLFEGWGEGACCHPDGSCTDGPFYDCTTASGGYYQGHDTTCAMVQCPVPSTGACCDVNGVDCSEMSPVDCGFNDGLYMGGGTQCGEVECPSVRYRNVLDPLENFVAAGAGLGLADDIELSGAGGGDMVYYDLNVYGGNDGAGPFDVTVSLYNDFPGSGGTQIAGTERTFTDLPENGSPVFISAVFDPPVTVPHEFWMVAEFSNGSAGWFRANEAEIGITDDVFGRNVPPWTLLFFGGNPHAGLWANVAFAD